MKSTKVQTLSAYIVHDYNTCSYTHMQPLCNHIAVTATMLYLCMVSAFTAKQAVSYSTDQIQGIMRLRFDRAYVAFHTRLWL